MIIFPMVGLSSRFQRAGYKLDKWMLPLGGHSVFSYAVSSFQFYFNNQTFLFIVRDQENTEEFVRRECKSLGIKDFQVVILPCMTRGQAETVIKGLSSSLYDGDESITIFNIDTFRPDFRFPDHFNLEHVDGFLEVFEGSGKNWSYVLPDEQKQYGVAETAEKHVISNLCCTGLYYFRSAQLFETAYEEYAKLKNDKLCNGELYVAPLYNILIQNNFDRQIEGFLKQASTIRFLFHCGA